MARPLRLAMMISELPSVSSTAMSSSRFADDDGVDAVGSRTRVGFERCFLDYAAFGSEHKIVRCDEIFVVESFDADKRFDGVAGFDREKRFVWLFLGVFGSFGYVVDFKPVAPSAVGEEEHIVVHRCGVDMLDEVFVAGVAAFGSDSAAVLCAEFG